MSSPYQAIVKPKLGAAFKSFLLMSNVSTQNQSTRPKSSRKVSSSNREEPDGGLMFGSFDSPQPKSSAVRP